MHYSNKFLSSKFFSAFIVLALIFSFNPIAHAKVKEAGASLILPTTGQAMNGQLGNGKTKFMAGVEIAAITAITVIGFAGGGPAVWFGAGPLVANHLYSSLDAYKNAGQADQANITIAQEEREYSRERRFDREPEYRSDLRERIRRAGEQTGR